ncbi:hypothetical protein LCGC14_2490110, partial [marine sediment metagenome]
MPAAGLWIGAVVTDAKGKAVLDLPMPENTTQWRLTSRGCTVETLVGEATGNVITRKEFFVAIKAPQIVREGDKIRVLARIHNLTDYAGPVDLTLTLLGGDKFDGTLAERKLTVKVGKKGGVEALFDSVEIPLAAAVKVRVSAKAGEHTDALETILPVRPWGLEFADHDGGIAKGDATAMVELPGKRVYGSKWMTISVGPSLKRAVIQMALGSRSPRVLRGGPHLVRIPPLPGPGGFAGSDLLAVVSALEYAKTVDAPEVDVVRLTDRARSLVSALVVSQRKDGGWCWTGADSDTDWAVTAMSF